MKVRLKQLTTSTVIHKLHLILLLILIYLFLNIFHIGCPIKYFTGISCAGCGMTRAVHSALLFHFSDAFHYHPLFPLVPVMVFLFLFEDYLNVKQIRIAWVIIISLFLITYFIRLFLIKNDVVYIDINSSIMLKSLHSKFLGQLISKYK